MGGCRIDIADFRLPIFDCRLPIFDCRLSRSIKETRIMTPKEMRDRTKSFALRVIKLVDAMPRTLAGQVTGRQLLRSATSVGANYRAACRAQSRAEFAAKLSIVVEEADESLYWLELLNESGLVKPRRLVDLLREASELLAIAIASRKTAKRPSRLLEHHTSTPIINRQSAIGNRQSTIASRKTSKAPAETKEEGPSTSIGNRQSTIGNI
ncbi:MAG: four helix bundle protein [Terriglobia bacterium]|jgi:four helix bundle protein